MASYSIGAQIENASILAGGSTIDDAILKLGGPKKTNPGIAKQFWSEHKSMRVSLPRKAMQRLEKRIWKFSRIEMKAAGVSTGTTSPSEQLLHKGAKYRQSSSIVPTQLVAHTAW
jgi:hypothetical protein